jgi:hypothetical protein
MLDLFSLLLGGLPRREDDHIHINKRDVKEKKERKENKERKEKKERKENKERNEKKEMNEKKKERNEKNKERNEKKEMNEKKKERNEKKEYEHVTDYYTDSDSDCECVVKYEHKHHKHKHCESPVTHLDNSHNKNKIIDKLSDVIQQVNNNIAYDSLRTNIDDYFIRDPSSGILNPKFIQMNVNDTIINVPTYTLINHTNINVKEFKCKFKTNAYNLGVQCNKNFDVDTDITFTRDNVNDGYVRINELLVKDNF